MGRRFWLLAFTTLCTACSPEGGQSGDGRPADIFDPAFDVGYCVYEAELAGLPSSTAFPVVDISWTHKQEFCGWSGRRFQFLLERFEECPAKITMGEWLPFRGGNSVSARLVSSDFSLVPEQPVGCYGLAVMPDTPESRAELESKGRLANTDIVTIKGQVLRPEFVRVVFDDLRYANALPIKAVLYGNNETRVFWDARSYTFDVDICEIFESRLGNVFDTDATCES